MSKCGYMVKGTPTRPIMRYHGGKWLLAPWIISHFPEHRVYVEPFGGAASVLLRKPRVYAEVYNDLDGDVVNLFRVARDHGDDLLRKLELTPFARAEYYQCMRTSRDLLESARRLVVRSYMGFGSDSYNPRSRSGFRFKSRMSGTDPAHDWINLPDSLAAVDKRLQGVVIENRPAMEVMRIHDGPGVLHYCDPPYVASTRSGKSHAKGCYRHEMTDAQHRELAAFLRGLQGYVVVSGYDCPLYQELYQGWRHERRAALADGARPRTEGLWFSPNIPTDDLFAGHRDPVIRSAATR